MVHRVKVAEQVTRQAPDFPILDSTYDDLDMELANIPGMPGWSTRTRPTSLLEKSRSLPRCAGRAPTAAGRALRRRWAVRGAAPSPGLWRHSQVVRRGSAGENERNCQQRIDPELRCGGVAGSRWNWSRSSGASMAPAGRRTVADEMKQLASAGTW